MKICWDNLENIKFTMNGNFRKGNCIYIEMDACKTCNEPYLSLKSRKMWFCSNECRCNNIEYKSKLSYKLSGANNPMFGKHHSEETKKKIGLKSKNNNQGRNNPNYGNDKLKGKNSSLWKGGVTKKNIPLFDTYAHQISFAEEVRRNIKDKDILEVKCAYCGKWYIPNRISVKNRIRVLNNIEGESRFYCSTGCKHQCPIFNRSKYPKGYKKDTSREVQPELRQMVFERDEYQCQKCGSTKSLHCHHIEGIRWEPLESADIDNCLTLCKKCHKEVHKKEGCDYNNMRCIYVKP